MTDIPADADCSLPTESQAPTDELAYQVCVVGGGIAGICAAVAAARAGARTLLVQDRAVLGGNASSEVRMWICGAHGPDNKETGLLEELQLANMFLNPERNYAIWDSVLYGFVRQQAGLDLLLSCSVCTVEMDGPERIAGLRAWHLTRQRWQHIRADTFIDCSGDSILRLSGAPCRWGREAAAASNEAHAQPSADRCTMGNTVLIQLREIDPADHRPFRPPTWALPVDEDSFPKRKMTPTGHNFWWLEIGGLFDTIADADRLRDDLIALAYGVWAYIKNHPDGRGRAWELEWIGALPGKRENVRYVGDHILTEEDIDAGGRFDDLVGHGGWTMDDHPPAGIYHDGDDTTHHAAPSPYGIPYRCLYSSRVGNLWFAGRNISATHMAMSSTRVMATCATLGQAAGSAAAIAVAAGCDNRAVGRDRLDQLQRRLLDDDQWLPGRYRPLPSASRPERCRYESSRGDAAVLRDGIDRREDATTHRWDGQAGDWVGCTWPEPVTIDRVRLIGDSNLHDHKRMPCSFPLRGNRVHMPAPLPRHLRFEARQSDGSWHAVGEITDNHARCIRWTPSAPLTTDALRVVLVAPWGTKPEQRVSLFAFDVGLPEERGPIDAAPWPPVTVTGRRQPSA